MAYPDPCQNIFSRYKNKKKKKQASQSLRQCLQIRIMFVIRAFTHLCNAIPDFTDNNLVNIIRYGQDYYAASEINYINQIDPVTLETVGRVTSFSLPAEVK